MKFIKGVGVLLIIGLCVGGLIIMSVVKSFDGKILTESPVFFDIPVGSSFIQTAVDLEEKGIIESAMNLRLLAYFEGNASVIAAQYQFNPDFSLRDVYNAIIQGESLSSESQVTIIEGLTLEEIANKYEKERLVMSAEDFIESTSKNLNHFVDEYLFLQSKPEQASLEGYLFPDTYRFYKNSSIEDIVHVMLDNMEKKLTDELLLKIDNSGRTVHEVITLASIIEKEVRNPDDMKTVAGIFKNRLDIGMALQADSTINYLTKSGRDRSTAKDLEIDSLYNTYKYPGLPPGAVSNPGMNAILAAVYPEENDYMYFLTDNVGKVYYAKTFAEHQNNRQHLE